MVAKFFKTSKPIHSVIIAVFLLGLFILTRPASLIEDFSIKILTKEVLKYMVLLASVFVLDFLANKNKLTLKNGFEILIFSLLLATFPSTIIEAKIFVANFFVLLALRRIISLRSNLRVKKKLFDATFWICIAGLFHFWALSFLLIVFVAMILHSITNPKNWIVPFTAMIVVILLVISYNILTVNNFGELTHYLGQFDANFSQYKHPKILLPLIILALISIWSLTHFLMRLNHKQKSQRPSFILIILSFIVGLFIVIISPNKNSSELIFLMPSLTIIISNCLESLSNKWVAEISVWILLALPFLAFVS